MPKKTTGDRPELKPVNVGAAAIDIGSKMHMAAVNPACTDMPVRTFGTFTQNLHDLADWFKACGVTSVAMESTGVYWIPVYEILEQRGFEVILVNARYAKNVPGRKTDVSDAAWLRQLHSYGLLRGSFRPDAEIARRAQSRRVGNLSRRALPFFDRDNPRGTGGQRSGRTCLRPPPIAGTIRRLPGEDAGLRPHARSLDRCIEQ
jgi:transposase